MHDKFMKLLAKKGGEQGMDPMYKKSKLEALGDLKSSMKDMAGDNLKKVMVASSSKEGLEKGLEKAEDVVESLPEGMSEEKPEMSMSEEPSEESDGMSEQLSVEQLDEMIKKLEEMKQQKLQG